MTVRWLPAILTLLLSVTTAPAQVPAQPAQVLVTPAGVYEEVWADVQSVRAGGKEPRHYRWLHAQNSLEVEVPILFGLAAFVSNSLNFRERPLVLPVKIGPRLLRINICDLGIDPKVWDQLGELGSGVKTAFPEPYYHQRATKVVEVLVDCEPYQYQGHWWRQRWIKKTEQVVVPAIYLPQDKVLLLRDTVGTEFPVYRTDWFVAHALEPPAYTRFQGNPKAFSDFLKLAGVDVKVFDRTATTLRGVALWSEVAENNRILERAPSETNYGRGYFYQTFDYFTSLDEQDVYSAGLLNRKRDAGEIIWSLPNGLQGYGLVNGQDKVIDFADPFAALDRRTTRHLKVLQTCSNCVGCHGNGLIPVADEVRLTARDITALVPDPKQVNDKQVRQLADRYFGEDINRLLIQDQVNYAVAMKTLTGKAAAAVALEFEKLLVRYYDGPLTLQDVAREVGYPEAIVREVIEGDRSGLNHTFTRLLLKRQGRRDQFEAAFGQIQGRLYLKAGKP